MVILNIIYYSQLALNEIFGIKNLALNEIFGELDTASWFVVVWVISS